MDDNSRIKLKENSDKNKLISKDRKSKKKLKKNQKIFSKL